MLSQEEIRIKAGLDYSKVTAGLTDIRAQVFKLAKDVPNKLSSLLKANLYTAAAGLISEALPSWDEIWSRVYRTGEYGDKSIEETGKNLHRLRDLLKRSQADLERISRDAQMDDATAEQRVAILKGELALAKEAATAALERLRYVKDHRMGVEALAEAQTEYNNAIGGQIKAEQALKAQVSKLTPQQLRNAANKDMNATRGQVYRDRTDIRSLQDELNNDPKFVREMENYKRLLSLGDVDGADAFKEDVLMDEFPLFKQLQSAQGRIGEIVRTRSIANAGDVGIALKNLPFMSGAGDAFIKAQTDALKSVVQQVKIVEVE